MVAAVGSGLDVGKALPISVKKVWGYFCHFVTVSKLA